jgi:hypothetical protein
VRVFKKTIGSLPFVVCVAKFSQVTPLLARLTLFRGKERPLLCVAIYD